MAFREFDTPQVSRRALLRGGAWLTAGAALAGNPMGRMALAQGGAANWQAVTAMVDKYVSERKVSPAARSHSAARSRPMPTASIASIR